MQRFLIVAFTLITFISAAQKSKKPVTPPEPEPVLVDTGVVTEALPEALPFEFTVYTKKPKTKKDRMKLCVNLVSGDSILNYCVNDSALRDPEKFSILYEKRDGDSNYVLVHVLAFSKSPERPECVAGKEGKLFFFRWNTVTNKAIVKQKSIESCLRGITNMTKEPLEGWDKVSPYVFTYHRGSHFSELTFDPANYKLGLQSPVDQESH